jgi:UDP-2,3-diacylglucosamine pyrophosphatase LpxH
VIPVRIASDWHLGPRSPEAHRRLALAFLTRARADGVQVILNGDVLDDLFAGEEAARSCPAVVEAMGALERDGRLRRTAGNHDPAVPLARLELEVPGIGRILVAHGHAVDPINASPIGRLGDGISRRFGRLAVVRGAAWLAEAVALGLAGAAMVRIFRSRCLAAVDREGFALGIFGHVHQQHLVPGDRYANAGSLHERLEYLELGPGGPRLGALGLDEVAGDAPGPATP